MESSLVHTVKVTAANEHDVTVTSELLTGDKEEVYGTAAISERRNDQKC